jgi:serine/threonine protein kinase
MQEHSRKPLDDRHIIGGYNIVRVIGQGGFGIVYEARNPVTLERVAIKQFYPAAIATWRQGTIVINRDDDRELVEQVLKDFETEANIQFNFNHPNILKVKNFIRADNTGYMISDYIDGGNLIEFLAPHKSIFPDEATFRRIMEPILDAVAYVHREMKLHRDISPDNIMIDRFERPVLVDFGAAKQDLRRTTSVLIGRQYKEDYAPVEQQVPSEDRPHGRYTDIFALAGTMYRLLAGQSPGSAVRRSLADRDPYIPMAQASRVKCSPAVYEAIDRGLMLASRDRPATVEEFTRLLGWPPPEHSVPPRRPPPVETPQVVPTATSPPPPPEINEHSGTPRWISYTAIAALVAVVCGGLLLINLQEPRTDPVTPAATAPSPAQSTISTAPPPVAPPSTLPQPASPPPRPAPIYTTHENRDIDGGDLPGTLPHLRDVSHQACQSACSSTSGCVGFAYGKWDRACYLKQSILDLRFEPNSTAVFRSDQQAPPNFSASPKMERAQRTFVGNRYSETPTSSRQACSDLCWNDTTCLGYQFTGGSCWRYDRIDFAAKDVSAQSGVKRQPAP